MKTIVINIILFFLNNNLIIQHKSICATWQYMHRIRFPNVRRSNPTIGTVVSACRPPCRLPLWRWWYSAYFNTFSLSAADNLRTVLCNTCTPEVHAQLTHSRFICVLSTVYVIICNAKVYTAFWFYTNTYHVLRHLSYNNTINNSSVLQQTWQLNWRRRPITV